MANLNKLFVYVPVGQHKNFEDAVIKNPTVADTYANKIVFLEKTKQLWVKKQLFGIDPATFSTDLSKLEAKLPVVQGSTGAKYVTVKDDEDTTTHKHTYTVQSDALDTKIGELEAADTALDKKIPSVAVAGSGLTISKSAGDNPIYTITADARLWEFMGSITDETPVGDVAATLNGKYGAEADKVRKAPEQGDTWAVNVAGQGTLMYAYDGKNWVTIGAANGVSQVDTNPSKGVALTNTNGVLGVTVDNTGAVATGNESVVTGGTVFTYLDTNYYTNKTVDNKINPLTTGIKVNDTAGNTSATYITIESDGAVGPKTYTVTFNSEALHNYVADNLWEDYTA